MTISLDSTIAVVGAGAMGSGIAQVAAHAGHRVILLDTTAAALARSRTGVVTAYNKLVERGKLEISARDALLARMEWTLEIEDVAAAAVVVEAIVEDMDAKKALFAKLAPYLGLDAILVSNTSSQSIEQLAQGTAAPERFAGLHFFNPVPVMKLVEVIPGRQTDPGVTEDLIQLMNAWGKVGVRVRDVPGFIVNRVARPYYAEGFAALAEGIAPAVVDCALEGTGGFRMGPLALADMIGHDVNYTVAKSVYDAYRGKTRFRPQQAQASLLSEGKLGRKSGRGVYVYEDRELPSPAFEPFDRGLAGIEVSAGQVLMAPLTELADRAGLELTQGQNLGADTIRVNGAVLAFGDGRTLADRPDVDVLVDHARDLATASIIVITARDDAAAKSAAGLFGAIDKRTLRIGDRPGQLVMRSLAQLANAAADAVADSVAAEGDIDAAMQFGANHPEGPLAWARRVGHVQLAAMLANIAAATNDPMYSPAPYFLAASEERANAHPEVGGA